MNPFRLSLSNRFLIIVYSFFILFRGFNSIDIIGPQWLYLSLFNGIVLFYLFFSKQLSLGFFKYKQSLAYSFFLLACVFSLLWAKYHYYTLLDLGRVFTTFIMCFNIFNLLKVSAKPFRFISYLMIVFVTVEVFYSLSGLFRVFMDNSFFIKLTKIDSEVFKGLSANPNITAASLVYKFPFILYFLFNGKFYEKVFVIILSFFYFLLLSFLASRASFLSLIVQLVLFIFLHRNNYKSLFQVALMLLLPFLASYFYVEFYNKIPNGIDQLASIRIENDSSSNRFYLWSHTIDYLISHPLGCGFGNWKIESIPYWKEMGSSYQVPYHAHNDFLEIFAETGFIGGFAYISIFLLIFYNLIVKMLKKVPLTPFVFLLFTSYSIDAFFNFPLERSVMQFLFAIMFVLTLLPRYNEK